MTKVTVLIAQSLVGCCMLKLAVGEGTTLTGTEKDTGLPPTVPVNTAVKLPGVITANPPTLKFEGGYEPNVQLIFEAPAGALKVMLAGEQATTVVTP